jgi:predicted acylesterase/phospholipase RssA
LSPRELSGIPILETLVQINHGSRYKTAPLHAALKKTFGDDLLFSAHAQKENIHIPNTKVAVVATDAVGTSAVLISNYNRDDGPKQNYKFERSQRSHEDFKVWEAAAATSAAPSLFKQFINPRSGQSYVDGALYYNCPAQVAWNESKLLWPELGTRHPDLLLSLGTGKREFGQRGSDSADLTR